MTNDPEQPIKDLLEEINEPPIPNQTIKDLILEENAQLPIKENDQSPIVSEETPDVLFTPETLNRNSTSFPLKLKESFTLIMDAVNSGQKLSIIQTYFKYYQLLTYNYFNWMIRARVSTDLNGNNYVPKGMLISYTMGGGKTAVAVGCALAALKTTERPKKIIVMLLKSLQENFVKNIVTILEKTGMMDDDITAFIKKNFKFVAFNASNMIKQLFDDDDLFTNVNMLEVLQNSNVLEHSMIIVDEYHLLGRAITNGSKNGQAFYNVIMKTQNVKLLFLTGSIISNSFFELAICYNLLSGMDLFPTDYFEFRRIFCTDKGHLKPEMRGKFQNRIMGLTSYVGLDDISSSSGEFTPRLKEDIIIKVKMTEYQTGLYVNARRKELEEVSFVSDKPAQRLTKPKSENMGSYKQKSRQYSNYVKPLNSSSPKSPKFEAILKNLELEGTHIIYSQYVNEGGLGVLRRFLEENGYEPSFTPIITASHKNISEDDIIITDNVELANNLEEELIISEVPKIENSLEVNVVGGLLENNKKYKYALFTGEEEAEVRNNSVKVFNSKANINGDLLKILMISSAGALGVDTSNCRYVHVMEPYWTEERILQVKGRALRLNSHKDLPLDQRFVQTFIYQAFPLEVPNVDKEILGSTDQEIYEHAKLNFIANKTWIDPIYETSIECPMKDGRVCRVCAPTNQPLFSRNIISDMKGVDACTPYKKSEIEVKETIIEVDGDKIEVYYKVDEDNNIEGFIKDLSIGAHRKLRKNEKLYELLVGVISGPTGE